MTATGHHGTAPGRRPVPRLLVADIGATKCLLAVAESKGGTVRLTAHRRVASRDVTGLDVLVGHFLDRLTPHPHAAVLAVPGPVRGDRCHLTNLPWTVDGADLARRTGLDRVVLVNDLAAAARGVPATPPEHLVVLHGERVRPDLTIAVLGVGTGLGEAVLLADGAGYRVLASEGGHADFAPQGAFQRALAEDLETTFDHVSVERVLSGPGLARIYNFLVKSGMPAAPEVTGVPDGRRPEVVSKMALARAHATCEQALDIFVRILGAEAGNLALRTLAYGGVVLVGGIVPTLLGKLTDGELTSAFLAKGKMRDVLQQIPVAVCTDPDTPLRGAALLALERRGL